MNRCVLVFGCLGLLSLGSQRLCAQESSRAGYDNEIDPDRQLVYNVEGLT